MRMISASALGDGPCQPIAAKSPRANHTFYWSQNWAIINFPCPIYMCHGDGWEIENFGCYFQGVTFLSKWGQIRNSEKTQRVRVWFKDNIWSEPPSISISALTLFGEGWRQIPVEMWFSAQSTRSLGFGHKSSGRVLRRDKKHAEICERGHRKLPAITGNNFPAFTSP